MHVASYGTVSKYVAQYCQTVSDNCEANPDLFIRRTILTMVPLVRMKIAKLLNVSVDEVVLVPNTTHGINTVLKNYIWKAEDCLVNCQSFLESH
jgi:selenocysteine lyase/cysteine desulfurase